MKKRFQTPGVYVQEVSLQTLSIAQVETAIPAFIGYTEKSISQGIQVLNTPTRINSFLEFEQIFGKAFPSKFEIVPAFPADPFQINFNNQPKSISFLPNQQGFLYFSVKAFFENGGRTCYIVSVGNYGGNGNLIIEKSALISGISNLENETEPSILVIPDAVILSSDAFEVYQQMLAHCGAKKNRFAILDIPEGYQTLTSGDNPISEFRKRIGNHHLAFGAAYYPWLYSSIASDPSLEILDHFELLDHKQILPEPSPLTFLNSIPKLAENNLHQGPKSFDPTYLTLKEGIQKKLGLLPPSGFIAGVYARIDRERGVWKAPANVSLNGVIQPAILMSASDQENLNLDPTTGKSINVIRSFPGKGILVWGARTLAGNDLEWRYISIKRTVMMIEDSIRLGLQTFVFEPNDANTWVRIKSMVENFLTQLWQNGALMGNKPEHAFGVKIGLGETMTNQDILEKRMIMTVLLALVRPAEFIVISFNQKMES